MAPGISKRDKHRLGILLNPERHRSPVAAVVAPTRRGGSSRVYQLQQKQRPHHQRWNDEMVGTPFSKGGASSLAVSTRQQPENGLSGVSEDRDHRPLLKWHRTPRRRHCIISRGERRGRSSCFPINRGTTKKGDNGSFLPSTRAQGWSKGLVMWRNGGRAVPRRRGRSSAVSRGRMTPARWVTEAAS